MPPQPLSNVRPNARIKWGHPIDLGARPDAALGIARCIAAWSAAEFQLGLMMVAMLGEVAAPTVAIYLELLALRTRTLALSAAAKSTLNQHEHQIFEVLVSMTRASAKKRDKLAHWLWTYSDDISDALLLIDPRDQIPQVAPAVVKLANNRPVRESEFIVAPSRIYVYRPGDFAEIEREFRELENCLVVFNQMVLESSVGEQFRLLTELSRRPPVAQRLFRLRKDQNSRAPPEQSPDAGDPD